MKITRREFTKTGLAAGALLGLGGVPAIAGPEHIIGKAIPSSGEHIPVIGLGTNRYGRNPRGDLREALARFHALGGSVIDTAPMYGESENMLGDLMADLDIRDEMFVATKVDKRGGREESDAQMNDSAAKLRTNNFELM